MSTPFPPEYFRRYDDSPDEYFYSFPRMVVHIDEKAISAASKLYGQLLPPNGVILDLMSSWRTHLPETHKAAKVVGLGMNAEEMAENPQLTEYVIHNLNRWPQMPFADNTFDGAICTVSVQYLTNPIAVFTDLRRVLKPGGVAVFTFSNRCFPTKAVAIWQAATMNQRAALVTRYFEAAQFAEIRAEDRSDLPRTGFLNLFGNGGHDPLMAVWGYKPSSDL